MFVGYAKAIIGEAVETIVAAAGRCLDGSIVSGTTHGDCLSAAVDAGNFAHLGVEEWDDLDELTKDDYAEVASSLDYGFLTNTGRFVSREEADKIATGAGQVGADRLELGELHADDFMWPTNGATGYTD